MILLPVMLSSGSIQATGNHAVDVMIVAFYVACMFPLLWMLLELYNTGDNWLRHGWQHWFCGIMTIATFPIFYWIFV